MKIILITILMTVFFLSQVSFSQAKWEEIIPLKTNRKQIENNFGKAKGECNCEYETKYEVVEIDYSKKTCGEGWKVPIDTVLKVSIAPKHKLSFASLRIDLTNFNKVVYDDFSKSITNLDLGVTYYTNSYGALEKMEYFPSSLRSSQSGIRCDNYPKYNKMNDLYTPALNSKIKDLKKFETTEIDINSTVFGNSLENSRGYIIIYFSDGTSELLRKNYLSKLRNLINQYPNKINQKLKIINGGTKNYSELVMFILPNNLPEPTPSN